MRLLSVIVAAIWMMAATTAGLVASKIAGLAPVAEWSWWAVWAPTWGLWLVVAIMAFCVGTHMLLMRLERTAP